MNKKTIIAISGLIAIVAVVGIFISNKNNTDSQWTKRDLEKESRTDVKRSDTVDTTFSGTETTYINNFYPTEGSVGEYSMIAELDFVQRKTCPGGEYHGPVPCVVNENPKVRYFFVRNDVKGTSWDPDSPIQNLSQLMEYVKNNNASALNPYDRQWYIVKIDKGLITEIRRDFMH